MSAPVVGAASDVVKAVAKLDTQGKIKHSLHSTGFPDFMQHYYIGVDVSMQV